MFREKFSLRQKKIRGEFSDVFRYDEVPRALRAQISHLLTRCMGVEGRDYMPNNPAYPHLQMRIAEELGRFSVGNSIRGSCAAIMEFFTNEATDEQALDIIDLAFAFAVEMNKNWNWRATYDVTVSINEVIQVLNRRLLEHGVGYAFINGDTPELIRIDNQHLHKDAVLPALRLLHDESFDGANDEYRKAHAHYRKGNYKECLNECLKAFESTLKTICNRKKWPYKPTDTASSLLDICLQNGLFPAFMAGHLGTIKAALATGIPTSRNKLGGHGQGEQAQEVPPYYAEYLINETAAAIVFLVSAFKG